MKTSLMVSLATGVLSTLMAMAADQPAQGGGGPGGGRGGPGGGPGARGSFQGPGRGGMMVLDEQQRQLYQQALQKESTKLRGLSDKLRLAQKDLMAAVLSTNYSETVVQEKAEAMSKIQVEITLVRAGALAAVAPSMKPEQRQQLIDSPSGMALLGAGGAGGPGGGGPRGGGPGGGPGFGPGGGGPGGDPGHAPGPGFPGGGRDQQPRER